MKDSKVKLLEMLYGDRKRSNCCGASMFLSYGGQNGYSFYVCKKCQKACDEKIHQNDLKDL